MTLPIFLFVYLLTQQIVYSMDTPVIGILSQEVYSVQNLFPNETYTSFIAASYVKFLESSGARVIPVWIGRDRRYYEDVVNKTNGILLPGGATWFNQSDGYADAGQHIYDVALQMNKNNDYYPIWGTCLGMELLIQVSLDGKEIRDNCMAKKISMPLKFKEDFRSSKLFSSCPEDIITILKSENVTYNFHTFCFSEETFDQNDLKSDWRIISTNNDINGFEFISTYESKKYPFFGVQFHPEKNPFEFKQSSPMLEHTDAAIRTSQYFSRFVVNEARKCNHKFTNLQELQQSLIFNYNPKYTSILNGSYEQLYMFTAEDNNKEF